MGVTEEERAGRLLFGMKRDDLYGKLQDQYNTLKSSIQDPEAFHHDVFEISTKPLSRSSPTHRSSHTSAKHQPVFGWLAGPETPLLRRLLLKRHQGQDISMHEVRRMAHGGAATAPVGFHIRDLVFTMNYLIPTSSYGPTQTPDPHTHSVPVTMRQVTVSLPTRGN
ncbi:hypothetical protein P8C59_005493 [Phyllachora maydis]|uniref:Uncharacterized protein n=1 Tax=Phyllachora maydis TaxID=1825666 RepID=A0AAD9I4Z0_9PEZI|nr:hypothetical protein P8C59_005493 [Phyllachora maydis]